MPDADTAAVRLAVLVADTGVDARPRYFSEIAIGVHDDTGIRLGLVGITCKINIVDAGLDRPRLVHLAGSPLSALLVLQQALPVHDQDSLLHQYAPVYR